MKTRILTGIAFTLGVLAFFIPGWWTPLFPLLFILLIATLAATELQGALRQLFPELGRFGIILFAAPFLFLFLRLPSTFWNYPLEGILPLSRLQSQARFVADLSVLGLILFAWLCLMVLRILAAAIRRGPQALGSAAGEGMAGLYLFFPFSLALLMLYNLEQGFFWLVIAFFSPWFSDVSAYFAGSLFGKRKLIPLLSPKKTVAGFVGGIFGCSLTLLLCFYLLAPVFGFELTPIALLSTVLLGILLGFVSQLGDWMASLIKRQAKIKDYGNLFPGHGGVMDRFDSVLFTIPVVYLFAWLGQLGGLFRWM